MGKPHETNMSHSRVLRALCVAAVAAVCLASCPFSRMQRRSELSDDPLKARALDVAAHRSSLIGNSRRLLSNAKLMANGYPTLEQSTIDDIETDFCLLVDTTIDSTRNVCSISGGLTGGGESANEARSDITAGAIQLAFHDAGTYDASDAENPGGADGCACDKFGPNKGLDYIKDVLEPVYNSYSDKLSLADFWVICSNAAIKSSVAEADAPLSVGFKYGRTDHTCVDCDVTGASRLPDESKSTDHVEDVFVTRMGFSKKETVALMGAHSMGKMEPLNTGYAGKWDRTFAQMDNIYFEQILDRPWFRFDVDESTKFGGQAPYPDYVHEATKHEWRVANEPTADDFQDDTNKLLNTDMCLAWAIGDGDDVNDETCSTRKCDETACEANDRGGTCATQDNSWRQHVVTYANDNTQFLQDFAAAWQKLVELTPNTLVTVGRAQNLKSETLAYYCSHDSSSSSYYANCDTCEGAPICCDTEDALSSTASEGGGSRCTTSSGGVTASSQCESLVYPAACDKSGLQYYCSHDSTSSSFYANCDTCVGEPICCDTADTLSSTASDGGGSRCTTSSGGVQDTSACSGIEYPSACPSSVAYYCQHDTSASSYYANCDTCVSTPICCDTSETDSSTASNSGGSRCTLTGNGVTGTAACAGLEYPTACNAVTLAEATAEDSWVERID